MTGEPTGNYPSGASRGEVALRLRVGITGHRDIAPDHPGLAHAVETVLAVVTGVQASLSARSTQVGLTVVSSLAEGADRLLAHAVLGRGGAQLEVILPLDPADYRHDFGSPASREEFDALLAKAAAVDAVGAARSRGHAYELAGQAVVDRSDAMIVVWDGEPARGRGGTAHIHAYALRRKKPVFWIRVDSDAADLAMQPADPALIAPLPPGALAGLDRYNAERLPDALFAALPPLLAHRGAGAGLDAAAAPLVHHVARYFTRADALALRFQRWWFWTTRLVYALAAAAVGIVAAQILFAPGHERYAWFEFGALVCVTVLLIVARSARWHDRWISARYLAEQIRSLVFLALAGVAGPDDVTWSAGPQPGPAEDSGWTDRAVAEIWWSRPRCDPIGEVDMIRDVVDEEWLGDQLDYHRRTGRKYAKRSRRFSAAAVVLFAVSAVAALLHSLGAGPDVLRAHNVLGFLSIVIPAVAAALSGYAAQRDYLRHAERSRQVAANLAEARYRLREAGDLRSIRQVVLGISGLLRGEATGWYSVVRSQDLEPP